MSKYGVFFGPYFPAIGLNTEKYEVFSRSAGKYGPEKTRIWIFFTQCFILKFTVLLANSHFITNTMEL